MKDTASALYITTENVVESDEKVNFSTVVSSVFDRIRPPATRPLPFVFDRMGTPTKRRYPYSEKHSPIFNRLGRNDKNAND